MKEIIFKYLKSLNINGLATFKNGPAIFLDQAPDDSDSRWDGSQYGRIIYGLNLKDDSERKVSGTMEIAIAYLFNNQGYKNLLEAKKILKKAFEGDHPHREKHQHHSLESYVRTGMIKL